MIFAFSALLLGPSGDGERNWAASTVQVGRSHKNRRCRCRLSTHLSGNGYVSPHTVTAPKGNAFAHALLHTCHHRRQAIIKMLARSNARRLMRRSHKINFPKLPTQSGEPFPQFRNQKSAETSCLKIGKGLNSGERGPGS